MLRSRPVLGSPSAPSGRTCRTCWSAPGAEPHAGRGRRGAARVARGPVPGLGVRRCSTGATAAAAVERPRRRCAARSTREMRRRRAARREPGCYDSGSGRTVFKWNSAQRRVPASVQKLRHDGHGARPARARRRASRPPCSADGGGRRGHARRRPVPAGLRGPHLRHAPRSAGSPRPSRRPGLERVNGRVRGDESFFDRLRGGPASRFGISPYVGPLSALALQPRHPAARSGGAGRAIRRRSPPSGCASLLRRAEVAVATEAGAGPRSRGCPHDRVRRVTAARGDRAPHQPGLRQLLRRDAAQGRRRAHRAGSAPLRPARASRASFAREAGFQREGGRRLRASRAPTSLSPRDVGSLLLDARARALVRRLLSLAPARREDRHAAQADARHARLGSLPGEDRHAVRRDRARRATAARRTATRSRSRC